MNDFYEKIGSGLNKIQGTIQSSQTLSQYKKLLQETAEGRTELLIQLGEEVYKKIRTEDIEDDDLKRKAAPLMELDRKIFQSKQAIAAFHANAGNHVCSSCSTPVTEGDKFCGGCGAKVELSQPETIGEAKQCTLCEEKIPVTAVFCNCCGTKYA